MKPKPSGKENQTSINVRSYLRLSPAVALMATIFVYFLSPVIAVNTLAIYGVLQGWSAEHIEHWLSEAMGAKFALRMGIALVGIALIHGFIRLLKTNWKTIGLVKPKISDVFVALIGFGWYILLHFAAVALISILAPQIDFDQAQQIGFNTSIVGNALLIVFISLVVLPPLYEEILMRGLLFTGLRSRLSLPVTAIIVSSLFAIAHLEFGGDNPLLWAAAIDTFALSIVLVYVRERTGSLWPAIGLHAIKNFIAFLFLFVIKIG